VDLNVMQGAPKTLSKADRTVFTYGCEGLVGHEAAFQVELGRRIAALLGCRFGGAFEQAGRPHPRYLLPCGTLIGASLAAELGLADEDDIFGGWVPHDFFATKAIIHPVVSRAAPTPEGWTHELPDEVRPLALRGFTAFSPEDALRAGRLLLPRVGTVRLKPVHADGGRGQVLAGSEADLERAVERFRSNGGLRDALVVEENLREVITYSVGQLRLAGRRISYCGTQHGTTNNSGEKAYGGSDLVVVSGGFDRLLRLPLSDEMVRATQCARSFDRLADRHIEGFIASRRNYDIAAGTADDGGRRLGVIDQSWRTGGATGAEIAAIERFAEKPWLTAVRTRAVEYYGEPPPLPEGAAVYFQGSDPELGPMIKYAFVEEEDVAD
jgi:hypothetical protein